VTSRIDTSEY